MPADPREIDFQQDSPTTLYRFFNAAGELIYVGITDQAGVRFRAHESRSWWPEVVRIELECLATREAR